MANDFYQNDNDDNQSYHKTVALCVAAASLVVLLFLVILYMNTEKNKPAKSASTAEVTAEDNFLEGAHNFTSDELDFWDDYESSTNTNEENVSDPIPYKRKDQFEDVSNKKDKKDDEDESVEEADDKDSDTEEDSGEGSLNKDAEDDSETEKEGKIAVVDDKGNKKYYEILSKVDKNEYDLEEYLVNTDGALTYKDGKRESVKGIDLSKYNGTVDFKKLKDAGVDFVMLRLGLRGYGTGAISLDEKFVEYAQNAALNNIAVGAYFYSQAITEAEALEEANYIVGAVTNFNIKYPIAIDVEKVSEEDARTSKLTNKERTAIVKTFCDTVKSFGYKPAIYAERNMLITGLNLEELNGFDIWLADTNVPTDFPYKFNMWQYTQSGKVDGVEGPVDMDLSFVNYEQR